MHVCTYNETGNKHLQRVASAPDGDGVEEHARGDGEGGDEADEAKDLHLVGFFGRLVSWLAVRRCR